MTFDEIRFVIQKKDGSVVLRTTTSTRGWGRRRKTTVRQTPWPTWAAAQNANLRKVRREIDGKRRVVVEAQGTVMAVKLTVL